MALSEPRPADALQALVVGLPAERALQQIEQSKAALPAPSQPVQGDRWVNMLRHAVNKLRIARPDYLDAT